nr:hypothetical protein [Tanacetum cinerariifolium]
MNVPAFSAKCPVPDDECDDISDDDGDVLEDGDGDVSKDDDDDSNDSGDSFEDGDDNLDRRITNITVNEKNAYELKGKFLDDLHNNVFSGAYEEDTVKHVEYFLKIVDPIGLPNVNQDKLRVVIFPISLNGDAWRWKLKEEAFKNKAIMEEMIDDNDESFVHAIDIKKELVVNKGVVHFSGRRGRGRRSRGLCKAGLKGISRIPAVVIPVIAFGGGHQTHDYPKNNYTGNITRCTSNSTSDSNTACINTGDSVACTANRMVKDEISSPRLAWSRGVVGQGTRKGWLVVKTTSHGPRPS